MNLICAENGPGQGRTPTVQQTATAPVTATVTAASQTSARAPQYIDPRYRVVSGHQSIPFRCEIAQDLDGLRKFTDPQEYSQTGRKNQENHKPN
jgi:hypothetical protein